VDVKDLGLVAVSDWTREIPGRANAEHRPKAQAMLLAGT
jgi:hypothetical protein